MICVSIDSLLIDKILDKLIQILPEVGLIEIRLTPFFTTELPKWHRLMSHLRRPILLTLAFDSDVEDKDYVSQLLIAATLKPAFLDIPWRVSSQVVEKIRLFSPDTKLIISYHNFIETPVDLNGILANMVTPFAHFYKIAVQACHTLDMLRLMVWLKDKKNVIAVSMGLEGQPSRIIAPILGSPLTFACLEKGMETATGQLSVRQMKDCYHVHQHTSQTSLLGLAGDPIDKSPSDKTHNDLINKLHIDAVYLKMRVAVEEAKTFLSLIKQISFKGLSVTMPLKECIYALVEVSDPLAKTIKAVNTLKIIDEKILGFNTDALGALNAIESTAGSVLNKKFIIIGAGGAAKAIAYEAMCRGAIVTVLNRHVKRAEILATDLGCRFLDLEKIAECAQRGYDILVNTTPIEMPFHPKYLLPKTLVMDIKTRPKLTALLWHAIEKQCLIVYGYRMFVEQAVGQFDLWFDHQFDQEKIQNILTSATIQHL